MPATNTVELMSPSGLEKRTWAFYGHTCAWERRLARDDCHRLEWGKYAEEKLQESVAKARIAGFRLHGWK